MVLFLVFGLTDAVQLLVHLKELFLGEGNVHHSDHAGASLFETCAQQGFKSIVDKSSDIIFKDNAYPDSDSDQDAYLHQFHPLL